MHGVEIQEISFYGHSATFNLQDPASNVGQPLIQGYQQPWVIYFYQGRRAQDVHDVSLGSQKVPQLQLFCDVFCMEKKPSHDDIKSRMIQICMRKVTLLRILVNYHDILLMAEIPNNHLGCMKPYKHWDKLPTSTG